ncbi:D-TA family PLP-dependent enzyme [Maribacter sp. MMG018]|uniref:D-TA family PLP-dependent enzyme n=1 Tax=Maribacter sp. MMG018 TaxID=2822688 RepID=UPI001B382E76|nr:D-TA family PLP-dependent enzyme [Maribacter sp. MMG018]MBQ4913006.1 D-TA family PLP-dependent enzyme [Maribacter sp. MMG018]
MNHTNWYLLNNTEEIISPSLLIYKDRVIHNIDTMVRMANGPDNLRPHIKTHKTAEIIRLQMDQGIDKFKCATIAEAELLAVCKAPDVLLAMQPVGANMNRFVSLIKKFPDVHFSALTDNIETADLLGDLGTQNRLKLHLYIDLNVGMNRTGIPANDEALNLYKHIADHPSLEIEGLHAYDGHLRNPDPEARKKDCDEAFEKVLSLRDRILQESLPTPKIIAGGSPTFPYHCKRENVIASPGTTLLWDTGYGNLFPEMDFLPAAVLFTRVISKPKAGILCFDLGHKSIAPEMPFPRVDFLSLEHGKQLSQSEEHLVVEYDDLKAEKVGAEHYAIPKHICPTVAKYDELLVVENGNITDHWKVVARSNKITI